MGWSLFLYPLKMSSFVHTHQSTYRTLPIPRVLTVLRLYLPLPIPIYKYFVTTPGVLVSNTSFALTLLHFREPLGMVGFFLLPNMTCSFLISWGAVAGKRNGTWTSYIWWQGFIPGLFFSTEPFFTSGLLLTQLSMTAIVEAMVLKALQIPREPLALLA